MGRIVRSECGCEAAPDVCGALVRWATCSFHSKLRQAPENLPESYYVANCGAQHVAEMVQSLGDFDPGEGLAIEVGAGMSNYRRTLKDLGYQYMAVDPARSLQDYYRNLDPGDQFVTAKIEEAALPQSRLVLAAHCLEHVDDLFASMVKIGKSLVSRGVFYAVVPNGLDDLCNPDHNWFMTPASVAGICEVAGLEVQRVDMRSVVPHERFIYCKAVKK